MPTCREFLTSTESNQGSIAVCACNLSTQEAEAGGLKPKQQYQKPQINENKCEGEMEGGKEGGREGRREEEKETGGGEREEMRL